MISYNVPFEMLVAIYKGENGTFKYFREYICE